MKDRTRARTLIAAAALLTGFFLLLAPGIPGQETEEHTLSGDRVAVYNLAGAVEVVAHSGPEVVVEVRRGGDDGGRLETRVDEIGGRSALVVRYPGDRIVYPEAGGRSRTEVEVREDGTFSGGHGGWGWSSEEVEISSYGSGMEAWADLRVRVPAGRDVEVHLAMGETRVDGIEGTLRVDAHTGRIVSRDTRGELILDTGSGSVDVRGARGNVLLDTGSGSVDVYDVEGEELVVDTGSGSIDGGGIRVGRLRMDTGSGSIDLGEVSASEIVLDTGSGSIRAELTADVEDLEVDTGSGSVELRVPEELGARVELDTGSGGIDVEVPLRVRSAERNHLEGVLGDGRGSIRVDTGSGGITIRPR